MFKGVFCLMIISKLRKQQIAEIKHLPLKKFKK